MDGLRNGRFTSTAFGCLLLGLLLLGGCQTTELANLRQENSALRGELDRRQAALNAAETEKAALGARLATQGPGPVTGGTGGTTVVTNTGFGGIADIESEARGGNIHVRIPGDVLFASGQAALKPQAQKTLDQIAEVLQARYPTQTIRIEGYTDTDPIHKSHWTDNLDLSMARAASVHRHLQARGLDPKRMYASGFGQWKPRGTAAQSRRVEIVVVME